MRRLLVKYVLACFGGANHVPIVPAQSDLVQLTIFTGPGGDLLVGLGTELVSVSENGKSGGSGCMMCAWRWALFVVGVGDEGSEECEEQYESIHVGPDDTELISTGKMKLRNRDLGGFEKTKKEQKFHLFQNCYLNSRHLGLEYACCFPTFFGWVNLG
jgi:hypothetical protein